MKDTLFLCDIVDQRGRIQQRNRTFRLLGGRALPGTVITVSKDRYGAPG